MRFELIKYETVQRTMTTPDGTTTETTRDVFLRILDGEPIETGQESRTHTYQPDRLRIQFKNGELRWFRTSGCVIKADGRPGVRRYDDSYDLDGKRWIYWKRPDAPAEIMAEVRRWMA